jgi:hypothetical protein
MAGEWIRRGAVAAVAMWALMPAVTAHAAKTWDATPTVTCDGIVIDPPTWIKVTFDGTVNGTPFTRTAFYGGDGSHDAHVSIADLTGHSATAHVVVTADSPFFGTSHTADVTVQCGSVAAQGNPVVGASGDVAPASEEAGVAGASGSLPLTGGAIATLAALGIAMLSSGLLASRARSRRVVVRRDPSFYAITFPTVPWRMPERRYDLRRRTTSNGH